MKTVKITSNSSVRSGATYVKGLILVAGSANASIVLDDSTAGSGTDIMGLKAVTNTSTSVMINDREGIEFDNGVYATIVGTDAVVYVIIG